jgi:glycosyltransferase involved in cell wall biosynthesis
MSASPLVSIVINNFNYGRFLADAIDSALAQTYPNVEVVVVDDGSTDNSRDVIGRYGNRLTPVPKANGGQGSAFNTGFLASRGDLITYLDSDDMLLPDAIEKAVRRFENDGIVKVQWPLWITDSAGKRTGAISTTKEPPQGDLRELVIQEGPIYDWYFTTGCLLRRGFLENVLPMAEEPNRIGADEYLLTLVPLFGTIVTTPEPLGCYRSHGNNHYHGTVLTDERLAAYAERFEAHCRALQLCLNEQGVEVDPNCWKERNFNYLWPTRLLKAKSDLKNHIPEGAKYILVNGDEWGTGEPVQGRISIPFLENSGQYWGSPPDDATAIKELERLRDHGAQFIVFWWTQFWLLESLTGFRDHLRSQFALETKGNHLAIFDLRKN